MRLLITLLSCLLLIGNQAIADEEKHLLAGYDFDQRLAEVGPDTYQIFKHDYGKVGLSSAYKFSGERSLKIEDVAEDGGFPELQGYFETVKRGRLHFHFAFLVADTLEDFNIALAGKGHFRLHKHGIAFWLQNQQGNLHHYVAGQAIELFELSPFAWYQVDVSYDIEKGRYDLSIRDERGEHLVYLLDQRNAADHSHSSINKFSFIGDLGDKFNAAYYVDDVMLYTDDQRQQAEFIAPGRRQLFIDSWNDYHRRLYGKIQCVPATQIIDFGIDTEQFFELVAQGHLQRLNDLLENQLPEIASVVDNHQLYAVYHWQKGCRLLKRRKWTKAIDYFRAAQDLVGNARIYSLSLALAYAGAKQYPQADNLLASIQADWINDQRFAVAQAMIGISRNNTYSAGEWLATLALETYKPGLMDLIEPLHAGHIDDNMITRLKSYAPDEWQQYLQQAVITEQYYFALLWEKREYDALQYAQDVISKLEGLDIASSKWHERAADAAFYGKQYAEAIDYYQRALTLGQPCYCNYLKLADIYHLQGQVDLEREYRQLVYGRFDTLD